MTTAERRKEGRKEGRKAAAAEAVFFVENQQS
jgi:hypothetical protein